mmetsp:Transcript_45399/g.84070  ORF Transcript_45399/g.84070 Transcript_45399/m.84070 type:complete len:442 (-) Transcript_45399:1315-2640(-)
MRIEPGHALLHRLAQHLRLGVDVSAALLLLVELMRARGHEGDEAGHDQEREDGAVVSSHIFIFRGRSTIVLGSERADGQGEDEHDRHVGAEGDDVGGSHDAQDGDAGVGGEGGAEPEPVGHHHHEVQKEPAPGRGRVERSPEVSSDDARPDGEADGQYLGEGYHAHALPAETCRDGLLVLRVDHAVAVGREHSRGLVALPEDGERSPAIVNNGLELSLPPEQVVRKEHADEARQSSGDDAHHERPERLVPDGKVRNGLEAVAALLRRGLLRGELRDQARLADEGYVLAVLVPALAVVAVAVLPLVVVVFVAVVVVVLLVVVEPVVHPRLEPLDAVGVDDPDDRADDAVQDGDVEDVAGEGRREEGVVEVPLDVVPRHHPVHEDGHDGRDGGGGQGLEVLQSHLVGQFQYEEGAGHGKAEEAADGGGAGREVEDAGAQYGLP